MGKTLCTCEEGSLLLSTFHLLFFVSFLILSLTGIVYNQLMQLHQISQAYEAKALMEISGTLLQDRLEWEDVETATIHFSQGKVEISKESDTEYFFVARLTSNYISSQTVKLAQPPAPDDIRGIPENQESADVPQTDGNSETGLKEEPNENVDETDFPTGND